MTNAGLPGQENARAGRQLRSSSASIFFQMEIHSTPHLVAPWQRGRLALAPEHASGPHNLTMQASYGFLRAARVLVGITPSDPAEKAKVSTRSIIRIEAREPVGLEISMRVQKALEELGVEFLAETKSRGSAKRVPKGAMKKALGQIEPRLNPA